jgi:hypothetical protein
MPALPKLPRNWPAWLAVIEQPPASTMVTVLPATVQTVLVFETNVTGSPELALAVRTIGALPALTSFSAPNAIVCDWLPGAPRSMLTE